MGAPRVEGSGTGYRPVFRHRLGRHLTATSLTSELGDYIGAGALVVLADQRSGGLAVAVAGLFAGLAVGNLLVAILGSAFLDRISRRNGLVGGQLVGAGILLVPLLVASLAAVYVAAVVLGAVAAATSSIRSGAMADAVPEGLRPRLLALLGTSEQLAQVAGYATGSWVALTIGVEAALLLDIGTFLAGAVLLATAGLPATRAADDRPSPIDGLKTILAHPHLRLLAVLVAVSTLTTAIPGTLAPSAAGDATQWVPLILAATPLGAAIGFLIAGRLRSTTRYSGQLTHLALFGITFLAGGLVRQPLGWVAVNLMVGVGLAWLIGPQLTFLRLAPAKRMAQVTVTMAAVVAGTQGAGGMLLGWVADQTTVPVAYVAAGTIVLLAAFGGWIVALRQPARVGLDGPLLPRPGGMR